MRWLKKLINWLKKDKPLLTWDKKRGWVLYPFSFMIKKIERR